MSLLTPAQIPTEESVVLLDSDLRPIGTWPKATVHHADTPLHRAFSLFLFNRLGQMLVQRRSAAKPTWPGIWSNACCGHPALHEEPAAAVRRRARQELGIEIADLTCVLPEFQYRAEANGIVENEHCPVWIGFCDATPWTFDRSEIAELNWVDWEVFSQACAEPDGGAFAHFSPWSRLEGRALAEDPTLQRALEAWSRREPLTFATPA